MIVIGNKRIVDVVVSGTYITKGIFIDDRLNKILIQKVGSKYINHSAYVNMRDFDSPILILNYTDKKLTIEADSRVDRYLVE